MDEPVPTHPTTDLSSSPTTTEAAGEAASRTAGVAKQESKAVASTAADQARSVAGEAATQVKSVADEARAQAHQVVGDASSELRQQVDQRLGEAAKAARSTATELRALAEGRPHEAGRSAELVQQASQRLEHYAGRADELGVQGVAEELASFARRRPLVFLAGAIGAGVLAGRLLRTIQATNSNSPGTNRSLPAQTSGRLGAMDAAPVVSADPVGSRSIVAPASGATIGSDALGDDPISNLPGAGTVSSPGGVG